MCRAIRATETFTGTYAAPFGFAGAWGYQEDRDTGLMLLGHRTYDSSTGRFLTRDPIKDGRNWYAYAANNPTGAVDPSGLFADAVLDIIGVGLGVADFVQDPSLANAGWLALDVACLLIPAATGSYLRHGAKQGDNLARLARESAAHIDTSGRLARYGNRIRHAVRGTLIHSEWGRRALMEGLVDGIEVSYKGSRRGRRGAAGTIRIDAIKGSANRPTALFELKTGNAMIDAARIRSIQDALPRRSKGVPIYLITEAGSTLVAKGRKMFL